MITPELRVVGKMCLGCGTCVGVCPVSGAIELVRDASTGISVPRIDRQVCTRCNLCHLSCPREPSDIDLHKLQVRVFGAPPENPALGHFLETFAGYAADPDVRCASASGGVVTAMIHHALDSRYIDAALMVRSASDDPFASSVCLVRDPEEVWACRGSRYQPVAVGAGLKEVLYDHSVGRVAVVGVGCHIEGVRKAGLALKKRLSDKLAFTIGLFCKQTKTLRYTDLLLRRFRVEREAVKVLDYRGHGWPGKIVVETHDGRNVEQPFYDLNFLWASSYASPAYCLFCPDVTAEFADISVGDAWLPEFADERQGMSLLIVRTPVGQEVMRRVESADVIRISPVAADRIVRAQSAALIGIKKGNIERRVKLLGWVDRTIPPLELESTPVGNLWGYLEALWIYGLRWISATRLCELFVTRSPAAVLKTATRVISLINRVLARLML